MIAYDTAYTDQVSTATVSIHVAGIEHAPIFSSPELQEVPLQKTTGLGIGLVLQAHCHWIRDIGRVW